MKVEYIYAARAGTGPKPTAHSTPVYYYYTGETVEPGYYVCTFCGQHKHISSSRALPICERCDSTEFSALPEAA